MKIIKTRAVHKCSLCGFDIKKGSLAEYEQWRAPKYDDNDNQIGIEYCKVWIHKAGEECKSGLLIEQKDLEEIQKTKIHT